MWKNNHYPQLFMKKLCVNAIIKTHVKINHSTSTEKLAYQAYQTLASSTLLLQNRTRTNLSIQGVQKPRTIQGISEKFGIFLLQGVSQIQLDCAKWNVLRMDSVSKENLNSQKIYQYTSNVITGSNYQKDFIRFSRRLSSSNQGFKIRYSIYF